MATRAHGWRKGVDRVGEAAVHEARAEAERRVVRLGLVRDARRVAKLERDSIADPGLHGPIDGDSVELGRDLDAVPRAAVGRREQNGRSAAP